MSVTKGLLVRFDALPGKEDDVKEFLDSGRALVEEEPATTALFSEPTIEKLDVLGSKLPA